MDLASWGTCFLGRELCASSSEYGGWSNGVRDGNASLRGIREMCNLKGRIKDVGYGHKEALATKVLFLYNIEQL